VKTLRGDRAAPFVPVRRRQVVLANGQKRRLEAGLSTISGICRGLRDVDYGMAAAALTPEELAAWASKAGALSRALAAVRNNLKEVARDGG
jgi:hypothetical protein